MITVATVLQGIELLLNKPFIERIKFFIGVINEVAIAIIILLLFYLQTIDEAN